MKIAFIAMFAIMAGWTARTAAQVVSSPRGGGGPGVVGGNSGIGGTPVARGLGRGRGITPAVPLTLEATLTLGKQAYTILPAEAGEAFRNRIRASARGGTMPAPPNVDMTLELKNTGTGPVTITVEADSSMVNLNLEGPGAVNADANVAMTMEFRIGRSVAIDPGKSFSIPIKSLRHGVRGIAKLAYWTEPGEYTLTASYTMQSPDQDNLQTTIAAPPVKIRVTVAE